MSRIFITTSFFLFCCLSASAENPVANSGFETGLENWQEHLSGSAKAAGRIDKSASHSGKASFRMTNASPFGPNVYYRIFQAQQVKPNTKYLLGVWAKGQGVGKCWIGGGPNWTLKKQLPSGTYDWTWTSVEYTTGPDQTVFELMIVTESETKSLWVDDVYFAPVKTTADPVVYQARVKRGLTGDLRFYPALPVAARDESPAVRVRDAADPTLGCNIKINWDKANLYFTIDVLDPTAGAVVPGVDMWYNDCIQLGIDTQPEVPKDGYKASCVELGFGLLPDGKVTQYAWHTGGFDQYRWKDLPAEGNRTPTGYQLRITAPWTQLGVVNLDRLPAMVGVDVAVNDGQVPPKGRRYVEWTYGICSGPKTPDQFARVVLIDDPKAKSGAALVFAGKTRFDAQDFMIGRYIEYAFKGVPAERLVMTYAKTDGSREEEWVKTSLPAIQTGSIREFEFLLPAVRLSEEGKYLLSVRPDSTGTVIKSKVQVIRENTSARIAQLLAQSKSRTAELRKLLQNNPKLAANAYVKPGLTLADRFIKRVETGGPLEKKQSLDWSLLQLNQLSWVLDQTESFVKNPIFDSPKPTNGPVTIRNGVFYTDTTWGQRPFFFNGFGHFGSAVGDSPIFPDMGYTLIQHSRAPCEMSAEGQIWEQNRKAIVDIMKLTSDHKVKIDLLLAPHYFPEWAVAKDPEVLQPLYNGGWNKFNVNHPVARDAVGRFIDAIVPLTKDFPSMFAYCLMNEPSYGLSGRDKYSKPLWIEFLTKRHGSIDALNALYGTKYASFEQVPVPAEGKTVNERRAFFDWRDFNAQNFAEWHRFMHDRVKKNSPQAFTHSKILDWLFDPTPELICEVTDLAGNDVWALYTGGEYAFNWLQMEMWYDLLHSFKGQPVINSENHILPDSSTVGDDFPAAHTAAVLWQETLHHQGASEIWVWEEPVQGNLEGHMMLRPANIYAGGKALLDINRLGGEVAAINQSDPQVAILYALTASYWEKDVEEVPKAVYAAQNFIGLKITYVSERQLAAGKLPKCKCLVVPHATHVSSSTVDALQAYVKGGGTLVFVGNDNLAFDQYHRRRTLPETLAKIPVVRLKAVVSALREIPSLKQVCLVDLSTGQPAWGVEYRVVPYQGRLLVSMMNMLSKSQTVRLEQKGRAVDLITGRSVDLDRLVLEPMVPHLFQIGN